MDRHVIWQDVNYQIISRPPLTDDMVHDAERMLGVKLPSRLIDLLRSQNGGALRKRAYFIPREYEPPVQLGNYLVIDEIHTMAEIARRGRVGIPEGLVPIGFERFSSGEICLDYRNRGSAGPPAVTLYDIEIGPIEMPIAANLDHLLDHLVIEERNDCFHVVHGSFHAAWRDIVQVFDLQVPRAAEPGDECQIVIGMHRHWRAGAIYDMAHFQFGDNYDAGITVGFPDLPTQALVLRVNIHRQHRDELMQHFLRLPYAVQTLRLVDWDMWNPMVDEPR